MKKLLLAFTIAGIACSCIAMQNNLKLLDLGLFQITVPANWKYLKQQGTDSFIGKISGPGVSLSFDLSDMGYAGDLLKTEQEYISGRDWDMGFFYKPGIIYTANFNVAKEKAAQMKRLGITDSTKVKVEADPSYETKKNVLPATPAEKLKFPKADYIAHLSYRNEKMDFPITIPAEIKAHNIKIDSSGRYRIKTVWPKAAGKGLTGIYFKDKRSNLTFNMGGMNLSVADQQLALNAFSTIKIKE